MSCTTIRSSGSPHRARSCEPLLRRQTGHDLDLQGFDTDHIAFGAQVLFRNPYAGLRLNDDEIATAALLQAMAAWVRGDGPAPYPLAEGAQTTSSRWPSRMPPTRSHRHDHRRAVDFLNPHLRAFRLGQASGAVPQHDLPSTRTS